MPTPRACPILCSASFKSLTGLNYLELTQDINDSLTLSNSAALRGMVIDGQGEFTISSIAINVNNVVIRNTEIVHLVSTSGGARNLVLNGVTLHGGLSVNSNLNLRSTNVLLEGDQTFTISENRTLRLNDEFDVDYGPSRILTISGTGTLVGGTFIPLANPDAIEEEFDLTIAFTEAGEVKDITFGEDVNVTFDEASTLRNVKFTETLAANGAIKIRGNFEGLSSRAVLAGGSTPDITLATLSNFETGLELTIGLNVSLEGIVVKNNLTFNEDSEFSGTIANEIELNVSGVALTLGDVHVSGTGFTITGAGVVSGGTLANVSPTAVTPEAVTLSSVTIDGVETDNVVFSSDAAGATLKDATLSGNVLTEGPLNLLGLINGDGNVITGAGSVVVDGALSLSNIEIDVSEDIDVKSGSTLTIAGSVTNVSMFVFDEDSNNVTLAVVGELATPFAIGGSFDAATYSITTNAFTHTISGILTGAAVTSPAMSTIDLGIYTLEVTAPDGITGSGLEVSFNGGELVVSLADGNESASANDGDWEFKITHVVTGLTLEFTIKVDDFTFTLVGE